MKQGFNFQEIRKKLEQTKRVLPVKLANQARTYFTASFQNGGLEGEPKWPEVQRRIPGTAAYKYPKSKGLSRRTSPILVRRAILRRKTSNSIRRATWEEVRLVVDLPYAGIHNEGGTISVRGRQIEMPARPYMKQTETLRRKQVALVKEYMDSVWRTK